MHKIKLPYGKSEFLEFKLPDKWNMLLQAYPKPYPAISDIEKEINFALDNPINSPPLKHILKDKNKIAIVVDDISRPTPANLIVPLIIREIENSGFNLKDVTIVTALGLHREMTPEDMEKKVGTDVLKKVKWINHNCRDKDKLTYLGKTKRGTPVYINKTACEADFVILVGTIEPHIHAGFGGGYKNILPGVAGLETIAHNHYLSTDPVYFSMIGWEPEKNPMRCDIEEAGEMMKKDMFLVNTVLNGKLEIVKILTGNVISAYREGIKVAREIYEIKIPKQADIVITNSHPFDIDIRQNVKCVANTLFAAKLGGIIIAIWRCEEGLGNFKLPKIKIPSSYVLTKILAKFLLVVIKNFNISIPSEIKFFVYSALEAILRNRILIYAPDLPKSITKNFSIFANFTNFEEVIKHTQKLFPGEKDVIVFPYGGMTYPSLPETSSQFQL